MNRSRYGSEDRDSQDAAPRRFIKTSPYPGKNTLKYYILG